VVRRCVRSRNIVNEEALVHWGLLRQKKEKEIKVTATRLHRYLVIGLAQDGEDK